MPECYCQPASNIESDRERWKETNSAPVGSDRVRGRRGEMTVLTVKPRGLQTIKGFVACVQTETCCHSVFSPFRSQNVSLPPTEGLITGGSHSGPMF